MELEHLIGLGVVLVFAVLSAWLVWSCLCKNKDDMDDVESQQSEEEVKSVNSRTKVISRQVTAYEKNDHNSSSTKDNQHHHQQHNLQQSEQFLKPSYKPGGGKKKASCYVQSSSIGLADPFGEWTRREKDVDDTEALSGLKTYRKSPVLPHKR